MVKQSLLHTCKVCGESVKFQDSVYALTAILEHKVSSPEVLVNYWRGLDKDKHIRCSPSRAQWIRDDKFPRVMDFRPDSTDARITDPEEYATAVTFFTLCWRELQFLGGLREIGYDISNMGKDIRASELN